ncbi:hypothetical protein JX266_010813 [Neoarthrinium moseri]|nr:hypothetical protein JX266_010813 [Neoarthrinium moseri]
MAVGGDGIYMIGVLWGLATVVLVFLALRAYTRLVCVAAYGIDDHFYAATCVLVVLFSSFMQVAAEHGYGRSDLDEDTRIAAAYWRSIGQSFSLLATGTSKASVGFFLLRIVVVRWQRIAVWVFMTFLFLASILATIMTWAACKPFAYTWDDRIPGGTCLNTIPLSMILAMGTIIVDLFFAILPWIFIWKLNAPRREKFMIAGSLSLGIFAALAGAKRIMEVKGVRDVPVGVIVWSQTETSLTLVAVGIPVCRPLWTRTLKKWFSSRNRSSYIRQPDDQQRGPEPIGLHTFGGSPMPGANMAGRAKNRASNIFAMLTGTLATNRTATNKTATTRTETTVQTRDADGDKSIDKGDLADDRKQNEVVLSGADLESGVSSDRSSDVKRSWILGEPMRQHEVLSHGHSGETQQTDVIVTTKTYEVTRKQ